mmetsp:Transcript_7492/g.12774  ORF Transcript_7492/g.12774 Transcript_7492/m.12774 type:complete len:273 (-) Transcript_7492:921-1739(-)
MRAQPIHLPRIGPHRGPAQRQRRAYMVQIALGRCLRFENAGHGRVDVRLGRKGAEHGHNQCAAPGGPIDLIEPAQIAGPGVGNTGNGHDPGQVIELQGPGQRHNPAKGMAHDNRIFHAQLVRRAFEQLRLCARGRVGGCPDGFMRGRDLFGPAQARPVKDGDPIAVGQLARKGQRKVPRVAGRPVDQDNIGARAHLDRMHLHPIHVHKLAGRREGSGRITLAFQRKILHRADEQNRNGEDQNKSRFHGRLPPKICAILPDPAHVVGRGQIDL